MRILISTIAVVCFQSLAIGETRWGEAPARTDDLTGEKVNAVVYAEDDQRNKRLRSMLGITHNAEGQLVAVVVLHTTDLLPLGVGQVEVSYRADGAELQRATKWEKESKNSMYRQMTPEEVRQLIGGNFLVVSIDQSGKRYRYEFDDEEAEKFRKAVDALIEAGGR